MSGDRGVTFPVNADLSGLLKSMQTLEGKVKDLEKSFEKLNTTKKKGATESAEETKKEVGHLEDLRIAINRLKQAREEAKDAEAIKTINTELKIKQAEYNKVITAVHGVDKQTKQYGRTLSNTSQIANQFRGILLRTFGTYAIISGIKNTINTIKEFEKDMARVQAITGATGEEMQRLSQIARDVALKGGIFDPSTVAQLQIELSKLGFTAREIGNTVEPIVNLATAMGEDLGKSAEIAAATLRSFELDSTEMTRVIDVMGKAFASSALDMSRWAEGAKYAGPVANTLGWSVENLGAMMGVLANRQIFGSLAGTGLRNIMIGIADTNSDLYKGLGLTSTSFEEFIEKLEEASEAGLDFEDILGLVDRRTTTTATILAKGTGEIKDFNESLKNANGSIKEMADIQLQTLDAGLKRLGSSWKSFILTLEDGDGKMSNFFKDAVSGITEFINTLTLIEKYNLPFWKEMFGGATISLSQITTEQERVTREFENANKAISKQIVGLKGLERVNESVVLYRKEVLENAEYQDRIEKSINQNAEKRRDIEREIAEIESNKEVLSKSEWEAQNARYKTLKSALSTVLFSSVLVPETLAAISAEAQSQLSAFISQLKDLDTDTLKKRFDELDEIINEYPEQDRKSKRYEALMAEFVEIDRLLHSTKEKTDKFNKDTELARLQSLRKQYELEYQIRVNAVKANQEMSENEKNVELSFLEKWHKERIFKQIEARTAELNGEHELAKLYNELAEQEEELHLMRVLAINEKLRGEFIKEQVKYAEKVASIAKTRNRIEIKEIDLQIKAIRARQSKSYKDRVADAQELADKLNEKNRRSAELQIEVEQDLLNTLMSIRKTMKDSDPLADDTDLKIKALEETIKRLREMLKDLEIILPEEVEKDLASMLGIDPEALSLIQQGYQALSDMISKAMNEIVASNQAIVDSSNQRVSELQRDLETEISLAEQGFASNVSLKRAELEEEKKIRDAAIKDLKEAQKQQMLINAALDAANIATSVLNILASSTKYAGLAGIIAATVGAAGIYSLYASVKAKSKEITSYGDGGWEILKGKSHKAGGIPLGDGREAEGGEMMSIFSKKATNKYGKQIAAFTDSVNKDKIDFSRSNIFNNNTQKDVNVNVDDKRLTQTNRLLKDIRDNTVVYSSGYKIVKTGNRIRRIKLNGV